MVVNEYDVDYGYKYRTVIQDNKEITETSSIEGVHISTGTKMFIYRKSGDSKELKRTLYERLGELIHKF